MNNNKKRVNKGIIVLNKGERIAVISLLSIIVILLGYSVFRPALRFSKKDMMAFHNLDSLIAAHEKDASGFDRASLRDADHRGHTGATNRASLTGCSDHGNGTHHEASQREALSVAPKSTTTTKWENKPKSTKSTSKPKEKPVQVERKTIPVLDINVADSLALVELPQIGEIMASRIQRYRNRLGGFVAVEQLYEIKGMDSARFNTIKPYIILENNEITKINVNQDEFKTLLRHPYLEYEQVKAIVNHRERKGLIKNWEQLKGIAGEVNPLLERYVVY